MRQIYVASSIVNINRVQTIAMLENNVSDNANFIL